MLEYSLSHLRDGELLSNLKTLVAKERATMADVLAHIADVDARRLYLPTAHPSMHSYCVHELGLSEEAAFKRIHAARTARRFPATFEALADGRLHLSAIILLAPHLTEKTAVDLLTAAAGKTKAEVEQLLAERSPRPDAPERLEALPLAPSVADGSGPLTTGPVNQHAPGRVETVIAVPKLTPLSPERYALQVTIPHSTQEKLRYAQALLSHRVPTQDIAQVLDRALDALIVRLEKFGATPRPRQAGKRSSANPRYISLKVRREVWKRDGGCCTYVSESGRRCPARSRLEFDHVLEVARGGQASASNIRLRCRAHNQHGAECTFGTEFMRGKRALAQEKAARREATRAPSAAEEIIPALRELGFRADESRRAAAFSATNPEASLEDRVKLALNYLCPKRSMAVAPGIAEAALC